MTDPVDVVAPATPVRSDESLKSLTKVREYSTASPPAGGR